jgi:hypothetical protein
MEISEYLRDPVSAALIAGSVTAAYIHLRAYLNNEGQLELNQYTKPAVLISILVYFIVSGGIGRKETISSEPF